MKIAAVADLHGNLPEIPPCDLLLIAGDLCPDYFGKGLVRTFPNPEGQLEWLKTDFAAWWRELPCPQVVATYGNHDWVGEEYEDANISFDELVDTPAGAVWATPWSNRFMGWALMNDPEVLAEEYAKIPEGTPIIMSHQPPYGYGDTAWLRGEHLGSKELLAAIDRVKPRLVICGHIHGGYGHYLHRLDRTDPLNSRVVDIYNVSLVNEAYHPIHAITMIEWEP